MKIGIDLRPLYTGSRFRGIGTYTLEVLRELLKLDKENEYHFLNLYGEFPEDLQELFVGGNGLFPEPKEISYQCSCPDWALMCKHVAAVMYAIGVRFDENPFYFFHLRGIDVDRFIDVALENKVESMLQNADVDTPRILHEADITSLFGVL